MKKEAAVCTIRTAEKEREWLWEGISVLRLRMSFPDAVQVPDGRIRRFSRYYRRLSRSYERYCARFLFPAAREDARARCSASHPFTAWEAELSWRLVQQTEGLVSLYIDTREVQGGHPDNLIRRADTWNLYDGFPMRLSDFFPGELFYRRRLMKQLRCEILTRQSEGAVFREDWKKQLMSCFNPENFYIDGKGLHLYYQAYSLADASAGIPVFFFPWDGEKGPRPAAEISSASLDREAEKPV